MNDLKIDTQRTQVRMASFNYSTAEEELAILNEKIQYAEQRVEAAKRKGDAALVNTAVDNLNKFANLRVKAESDIRQAREQLAREKADLEAMRAAIAIEKEERKQRKIDARIRAEQFKERRKAAEAARQAADAEFWQQADRERKQREEQWQAKQAKQEKRRRERREREARNFFNMSSQQESGDALKAFCKGAQCNPGETINKCYHRQSRVHHPDKNPNDPGATQRFQQLGNLYASAKTVANWKTHTCKEEGEDMPPTRKKSKKNWRNSSFDDDSDDDDSDDDDSD